MDVKVIEDGMKHATIEDKSGPDFLEILKKGGSNRVVATNPGQLTTLITYSEQPSTAKNVLELLINDTDSFLMGLYAVGDVKGVVLFNALVLSKSGQELILNVLSTIRLRLKNDFLGKSKFDEELEIFLVTMYLNIISRFNICNPQHLQVFLALVNPLYMKDIEANQYKELTRTILLIVIKCLTLNKDQTIDISSDFFEMLYEEDVLTSSQFLNFIVVLELLFPVLPELTSTVYVNDQTKKHIMFEVQKFSQQGDEFSLSLPINRSKIVHLLRLINSSCITETCRTFNSSNYLQLLKLGKEFVNDKEVQILSVLDLVKIWNFIQLEKQNDSKFNIKTEDLTFVLTNYLRNDFRLGEKDSIIEYCIEGLAYLTLNVSIKESFRLDETIIEKLMSLLESNTQNKESEVYQNEGLNSSLIYGLLLIFTNLTKLTDPNVKNNDKSTLKFLKEYSNAGTRQSNASEDQQAIRLFNKALLFDHKVVSNISKLKIANVESDAGSKTKMNNLIPLTINIILMIATTTEKKVKEELVKQGALNLILNCLVKYSSVVKDDIINETRPLNEDPEIIETRVAALRSLAKILISVNPQLAFEKYDVKTCIPFLVELLGPDISQYSKSSTLSPTTSKYSYLMDMTMIDKYEGLLALTNLSSITTMPEIRTQIIVRTFDQHLNNLILDGDNPQIQRATWELISNLILEPRLLARFFNIDDGETSHENLNRLKILVKLLNSEDITLQVTIGGLLANATEHEIIAKILVANATIRGDLFRTISIICEEQPHDDELILRIGYVLLNLTYAAKEDTNAYSWLVEQGYVKKSVTSILRTNKNEEIIEVFIEIAAVLDK